MHDAMRGQHQQSRIVHVDQRHHDELVGSLRIRTCSGCGAGFVAKVESGFVAVMAVGDNQLLVAHLFLNGGNHRGIGDLPDSMCDAVFVVYFNRGGGGGLEQGSDLAGIFIEQKKLLVMGAGGAEQVEAIGLRFDRVCSWRKITWAE